MYQVLSVLILAAAPATNPSPVSHDVQRGNRTKSEALAESDNFVVRSFTDTIKAKDVAQACEGWRTHLTQKWMKDSDPKTWQPKCKVFVHTKRQSYLRSVGGGGVQTFGSSLVKFGERSVSMRRIDLLRNSQGQLSALPHELTHIVLADAFGGRYPPAWLDEGIATLADSAQKISLHGRDCDTAIANGSALRMVQLLTLQRLSAGQRAAFYGQSVSLVEFLSQREGADRLVPFVQSALQVGYERAIKEHYAIDGVMELERMWLDHATASRAPPQVNTVSLVPRQN